MSNLSKYNNPQQHLSEADMIRYKEGQMTDAEMHKVEKHLLECELCNDAYEGFLSLETTEYLEGIHQLKTKYTGKKDSSKTSGFSWKSIAAASIALIMLLSFALIISVGPLKEEKIIEDKVVFKNNKVIDNEPVVAENIQDTILNHHIVLNDPTVVEKESSQNNHRSFETTTGEEPLVLDKKTKQEEEEILVLAESFPREMETVAVEDQEFEEILQDNNHFSSDAPAPNDELKSETQAGNSKKIVTTTDKLISGRVIDDVGEPLPGVNVLVKGTNKGTITDIEGNYQIPVKQDEKVLVYNFIGYTTEEREILNDREQIVELEPDVMALSEVVVVGYGTNSSNTVDNFEEKINPKPIMGMRKYRKTLKDNINYPITALENNIEGSVILQFEVHTDGSLSDFNIIKSPGYGLDEEAIRLVKEGSQWKPATLNGNPVIETVKLRIPFKIKNR